MADRVIFMDDGVIVEQGTPEEVFETPEKRGQGSSLRDIRRIQAMVQMLTAKTVQSLALIQASFL